MDQPIVRFHYVSADGFGKDSYGWYDNLWLRVDWPSGTLQFVMGVNGEWSVEATFDLNDGLHDQLVDLRCGGADDGDAERLLPVLLESAAEKVAVSPLDERTVVRLDAETFMHLHSVAAERELRGLWDVAR